MRRTWTLAAATLATLLLAGCLLLPGRFTSAIDLRKDGTFSFAYRGEIHVLALSKLADEERNRQNDTASFEPSACFVDQTGEERPCTSNEIADQKRAWEEDVATTRAAAAEKKKSDEQMAKAMLGGIDPSDPRAAQEFAERLRRQKGWKSVIDKGDGKFEVEYAITGKLTHDFSFPTVEKLPMVMPFVTVIRRADGSVRIDAPAFAAGGGNTPFMGMAAMAAEEKSQKAGGGGMPVMDGTLVLTTDGEILANNTDEGPVAGASGRMLQWKVSGRTKDAPTALVRINP
ncbi:MAG: hypothetical protein ACO1OX_05645 [Novosphingobium sp.]